MVKAMKRAPYFALFAALLAAPAFAQDSPVVIGGSPNSSSVSVDMSVLDALGPEPNVPDMMQSGGRRSFVPSTPLGRRTLPVQDEEQAAPGTGGVTLHPPGKATPRATAPRASTRRSTAQGKKPSKPAQQQTARATPSRALSAPSSRPPAAAPAPPPVAVPSIAPPAAAPPPPAPSAPPQSAAVAPPARSGSEFTTSSGPLPAAPANEPPAPAPAPPPAPTAAAASAPTPAARPAPSPPVQTASLPPAPSTGNGASLSLAFTGEDATLSEAAKRQLDTVAARANKDEALRLQLMAYASGTGDAANQARRTSLSRALAVRSYLIDKGVRSTRIDVRALGNRLEGGGDPDRVDVIVGAK